MTFAVILDSILTPGGVVVLCSPPDPKVPGSNPGESYTSDFSIEIRPAYQAVIVSRSPTLDKLHGGSL